MNNIAYAICGNNNFYYKTLVSKQYINSFQWHNLETRGKILCGDLCEGYSYSLVEFDAAQTLTFNYHPKEAKGFLFIINQLTSARFVQLMSHEHTIIDNCPRRIEMYMMPANKLFTFSYAPKTKGKRLEFFVTEDALRRTLSDSVINILQQKSFFILSDLLNETLYNELCKMADHFFNHSFQKNNGRIIISLLSVIEKLKAFAENSCTINSSLIFPGSIKTIKPENFM